MVFFVGQLSELLHRPLLVDLVSFLHSDSLLFFLAEKTTAIIMTAVESRYFYELTGILASLRVSSRIPLYADCSTKRNWNQSTLRYYRGVVAHKWLPTRGANRDDEDESCTVSA